MPVLRSLVSFVPVAGIALLTAAVHAEDADLAAINRIRTEAFQRSRVMDYLHINVIAELPGKAPGGEFVMLGARTSTPGMAPLARPTMAPAAPWSWR